MLYIFSLCRKIKYMKNFFKKMQPNRKKGNIQVKGILKKEFRSKLEVKNRKIYNYMSNNILKIEDIMNDYTNYIYTIIRNSYVNLPDEDVEEIVLDVFLTLWNNQGKLDINKKLSSYIVGITRNLIKKKYRNLIKNDNIEDYENQLVDLTNIELIFSENEKQKVILEELEKRKKDDKEIFIQYYYEERNIKEISKIFNISESKVKSKLFRIRKKLKKVLNGRGYGTNE